MVEADKCGWGYTKDTEGPPHSGQLNAGECTSVPWVRMVGNLLRAVSASFEAHHHEVHRMCFVWWPAAKHTGHFASTGRAPKKRTTKMSVHNIYFGVNTDYVRGIWKDKATTGLGAAPQGEWCQIQSTYPFLSAVNDV